MDKDKLLKESCKLGFDEGFFFKPFLKIDFVRESLPKLSGDFEHFRYEWVNKAQNKNTFI